MYCNINKDISLCLFAFSTAKTDHEYQLFALKNKLKSKIATLFLKL